jgi:hypothetical protein
MRAPLASTLAIALGACTPAPAEHRPAPPAPSLAPRPATAAPTSEPAPPAPTPAAVDPHWKSRCVASIEQGLRAAAAQDPELRQAYVRSDQGEAVSVSNPLGFFLRVEQVRPDIVTADPPGIWQHRAESLHGSYHVMYSKDAGRVKAFIAFDGWPSPRVQPLLPILQAAVDRCFEG